MKKILVASLALVASASVASAQVRLGTEGAYMPWNGLDENNEVIGFEREVGDRLCEIAGLTCIPCCSRPGMWGASQKAASPSVAATLTTDR